MIKISYHWYETKGRKILEKEFPSTLFFKLSSQNHIDLIGIEKERVMLIEIKYTKKDSFKIIKNERDKIQFQCYIDTKEKFINNKVICVCLLLVRANRKDHLIEFSSLEELRHRVIL